MKMKTKMKMKTILIFKTILILILKIVLAGLGHVDQNDFEFQNDFDLKCGQKPATRHKLPKRAQQKRGCVAMTTH